MISVICFDCLLQINIIHINATSKNAADDKVKQALRRFAQTYAPPATILLISGDINFISELSDLRHRSNFRVILLHNQQASDVLKQTAHECHRFDIFTTELQKTNPENAQTVSPLVHFIFVTVFISANFK